MKRLILFGGSGGLGKQLVPLLEDKYALTALSSKDVDITKYCEVEEFFRKNPTDILINMSGVNYNSFLHKIGEGNLDDAKRMVEVNVNGNINLLASCLPQMRDQNYGRVILISSVLADKNVPGTGIYSASKSFLDKLVQTASMENISKGVTCNSIQLGYFDGGLTHKIHETLKEGVLNTIGLKRWGRVKELAGTLEYLINTEYVTGANLLVSGGLK